MNRLPCIRCGECCRQGGQCDIKTWLTHAPSPFEGTCPLLRDNGDGTTTCEGIESAILNNRPWHEPTRLWLINKFVGRGCDKPKLRAARAAGGGDAATE